MGIDKGIQEQLKVKANKITNWIKDQVNLAGKKGVIFGLSGGIDSALVAVLCKKAFPKNTMALILPCDSEPTDIIDAMVIIEKYNINYKKIDITPIYEQLLSLITENGSKMANANIKPRLRMIVLYYFSNILDYLVVGTGNKSEIHIGYFTKYGDGGVDILPIGNLLKSEVKSMASCLEIPERIINKQPSAGLWKEQTDENEMGFSYEALDYFLSNNDLEDKAVKRKISKMNLCSAHKRKKTPIPDF